MRIERRTFGNTNGNFGMTDFKFKCPRCKQSLEAPSEMMGEVIQCPTCKGSIQLPKRNAPTALAQSKKPNVDALATIAVSVVVLAVIVIAFSLLSEKPKPAPLAPKQDHIVSPQPPPKPVQTEVNPWTLMTKAETEIRNGDADQVAYELNTILSDFPQSHEAQTVIGLILLARQKGITPYEGNVSSCTQADLQSLKKSFDSMQLIAKSYYSAPADKRQAIDTIFGPGTFSSPDLSLDGLLNAMRQLDAARQKAIRGE